ncbi:hypothetical protein [Iodobacter fluviatilis]|uniref:hypothetical protein n=1 Tax=Iodobacter fluviatilis TaxID=537 RepID=UPI00165DC59F|nr:hypothetical protein [Iodobacter fluviatilis]
MRAIYVCILSCTSLSHAALPPISTPSGLGADGSGDLFRLYAVSRQHRKSA